MALFFKPVASIYVREIRTSLDPDIVPVFTPDTAIDVGDFGSFEDGRFVRKGNLADRGIDLGTRERPVNPFNFASAGKVTVGPSVNVPGPTGQNLLKADINFTRSKAVLASYRDGTERFVPDADTFASQLAQMWRDKELRTDRMVVWSVRKASGGTVVVSEDGGNRVEVLADASLLGPVGITLSSLALGVNFGAERKAIWKMTAGQAEFTVWARLFRVDDDFTGAVDAFGFDAAKAKQGLEPRSVAFTSADLLSRL
jgi:hypothetical protein